MSNTVLGVLIFAAGIAVGVAFGWRLPHYARDRRIYHEGAQSVTAPDFPENP